MGACCLASRETKECDAGGKRDEFNQCFQLVEFISHPVNFLQQATFYGLVEYFIILLFLALHIVELKKSAASLHTESRFRVSTRVCYFSC